MIAGREVRERNHCLVLSLSARAHQATIAIVGLLALELLYPEASQLQIGYTLFTYWILQSELDLFEQVKNEHRKRQRALFGLHQNEKVIITFPWRVRIYIMLLLLSIGATVVHYCVP